jgi:hypothetical protein
MRLLGTDHGGDRKYKQKFGGNLLGRNQLKDKGEMTTAVKVVKRRHGRA